MAASMTTQALDAPLTQCATFLVVSSSKTSSSIPSLRNAVSGLSNLVKNISSRHPSAHLSCTVGIGSAIWPSLTGGLPRPAQLHPFRAIQGARHEAVSTPGDVLFHIRAERRDVCFELERQLLDQLGDAVKIEDETTGFRYFDARDLLGFVDGTANPVGADVTDAVVADGGGSYIVVQKYLHDLRAWNALSTEQQQDIIGRTKMDNVELEDADGDAQKSHKTLASITDEQGVEHDILRDNMPFGEPGRGQYGTYFIGYARDLWVIERMLHNMFVGCPVGKYDRILDFSTAQTGTTFFAPSAGVLAGLGQ